MAVWEQLEATKPHVAYAIVGVFSAIFSLVSLFIKEKLYIGESTLACIYGLIVGPHCLNWFNPISWGNTDSITLEITRIVLCLQIFAVAVELPRRYMLKHWISVAILLLPVMTAGWLIIGLFVWIVIPNLNFPASLLISACITATDPILAQSVVSGKFAQRVPGHLRNLLSAESGCNDGMAFPFIFLSLNLILHPGNGGEIVKNWICITILYECIFGCLLGVFIGYTGRRAIRFAKEHGIIDRESFLSFYIFLSFCCAGFGSILGVDDLLVSFAAGTAFAWDGWFAESTEESKISTVIELLLNFAYFIYFGAIIPWQDFNNNEIGTDAWRLVILAIVVIFLRRIPAVVLVTRFIPDIKSWREAIFVGHFGPIGVGAVFAAILARSELEAAVTDEETPLAEVPPKGTEHWQLMRSVWPITCFFIVTSIAVHGSSVAVITLGRHLNTITLTKTFSTHTFGGTKGSSWMSRLPALDKEGRSFSLHRMDTVGLKGKGYTTEEMSRTNTIDTTGVPARHAGGMRRKKDKNGKKKKRQNKLKKRREQLLGIYEPDILDDELNDLGRERLQLEKEALAGTFTLSASKPQGDALQETSLETLDIKEGQGSQSLQSDQKIDSASDSISPKNYGRYYGSSFGADMENIQSEPANVSDVESYDLRSFGSAAEEKRHRLEQTEATADVAYADKDTVIIENKQGEILDQINLNPGPHDEEASIKSGGHKLSRVLSNGSTSSMNAIKKVLSPTLAKGISSDPRHKSKFHAYKVGNVLVIENEEGEVLRRYRINQHEGEDEPATVISKTLSRLGLRSRSSSNAPAPANTKQEANATKMRRNLTPAPKTLKSKYVLPETFCEEAELNESEQMYDSEESLDRYDPQEHQNYDRSDYSDEDEDEDEDSNDNYSSGEESETSFERVRRLRALGRYSAPRDDDDEEA